MHIRQSHSVEASGISAIVPGSRGVFRARQAGQSLTEFTVVALMLLVPTFLLIPVFSQIISTRQDVEVATRYAAWERTVWSTQPYATYPDSNYAATLLKQDAQIGHEIDSRIFSPGDAPIVTSSAAAAPTTLKPFMLVAQPSTVPQQVPMLLPNGGGYAAGTSADAAPGGLAGKLSPLTVGFRLNNDGLIQSNLNVGLIQFSWLGTPFDSLDLYYQRSNTLFTDAWNPGGRDHAETLIKNVLPEARYGDTAAVHALQWAAGASPITKEVRPYYLDFGYVNIDPVPANRLSPF